MLKNLEIEFHVSLKLNSMSQSISVDSKEFILEALCYS